MTTPTAASSATKNDHLASWTPATFRKARLLEMLPAVGFGLLDASLAFSVLIFLFESSGDFAPVLAFVTGCLLAALGSVLAAVSAEHLFHGNRRGGRWALYAWGAVGLALFTIRCTHTLFAPPQIQTASGDSGQALADQAAATAMGHVIDVLLGLLILSVYVANGMVIILAQKKLANPDLLGMLKSAATRDKDISEWRSETRTIERLRAQQAIKAEQIRHGLDAEYEAIEAEAKRIGNLAKEHVRGWMTEINPHPTKTMMTLAPKPTPAPAPEDQIATAERKQQ